MSAPVRDLRQDSARLRRWRCGAVEMAGGRLERISRRLWPRRVSIAGAWWDARRRPGGADRCRLFWHVPRLAPGVLAIDYAQSGRDTRLGTIHGALVVLDQIARIKQCQIAVCHVTNDRITDRLLRRWGWEEHCANERGRHWIRRYYGQYPAFEEAAEYFGRAAAHDGIA